MANKHRTVQGGVTLDARALNRKRWLHPTALRQLAHGCRRAKAWLASSAHRRYFLRFVAPCRPATSTRAARCGLSPAARRLHDMLRALPREALSDERVTLALAGSARPSARS